MDKCSFMSLKLSFPIKNIYFAIKKFWKNQSRSEKSLDIPRKAPMTEVLFFAKLSLVFMQLYYIWASSQKNF